jgi:GNAT superfamily N-acetyltransferase
MLAIRKSRKADIAMLAKIYKQAYDRPKFGEKWGFKEAKALSDFYFQQKNFLGLTALVDGKIVGAFFSYVKPWHDGNHLGEGELFVAPRYQNQKIGTKLFLEMMVLAQKKKCVVHELVAYPRIARWYAKIGMKSTNLQYMAGDIKKIIKKIRLQ